MTGWRVGWMVVPDALVRPIERLQRQSRDLGADAVADRGRGGLRRARRDGGGQARLRGEPPHPASRACRRPGSTKFLPVDGAFYLYADVSRFSNDSFDFAKRMLEEAHVAATPGVDFDPVDGTAFHPLLLRRLGGRDARGGGADRAVARTR